ncbi:MAG: diguanylate cyclase (GGDEF)-like protein [Gammaproteobacteria bacterium]|jgi:diguanylate cyclase (GGDEF)-like protein
MSFARQITLIVFLTVVGALAMRAVLTVHEMRGYLATQLQSHARDAARSLGLSISLHLASGDDLFAESIVDSMFDSGDYEAIQILATDGTVSIDRTRAPRSLDAPQWFIDWVPITAPQASAELTTGWTQVGSVVVRSHPGYAYEQLWRSAAHSVQSALIFLVVALVLLSGVLRVLLRPLQQIEEQALAVANREFPRIEKLPSTREFRRVAQAMNLMTDRVESFIEEHIEQARRVQSEAYQDPVTGLRNRRALSLDVEQLVRESKQHGMGALMLINVRGLEAINRSHGYESGNAFMATLARVLSGIAGEESVTLGRWGGAIFAIVLPQTSAELLSERAQLLVESLSVVVHEGEVAGSVSIGAVISTGADDANLLISKCEAALHNAESSSVVSKGVQGRWHLWQAGETAHADEIRDEAHWQRQLKRVISERDVVLESQPVMDMRDGRELHQEVLARFRDEDGSLISAGQFIPVAARLGLSTSLDVVIIEKVLGVLTTRFNSDQCLAVNLSGSAVQDVDFVRWLARRLASEPRARRERLYLEVTEHVVTQHREAFRALADAMAPLGVALGVDHCGAADVSLAGLRGLPVAYAKLYGALVHGVHEDRERQTMLRSLVSIGHGMGLSLIAEFVENDAEYEAVRDIGFDGSQGFHLGRPQALE